MAIIRLQKYLADSGIASRRKSEQLILVGLIKVNSKIITELGSKVDTEKDKVEYQNKILEPKGKLIYIMLNKPAGYVTSLEHEGKKTILDLVKIKERVFPVGRLDELSQGLLILTNDGDLAFKLTHPKFEHEKEYIVETITKPTEQDLKSLAEGIIIDGKRTSPAKIKKLNENKFSIIIHEGRNRQIRKMCAERNIKIKSLKRIRIGPLKLSNVSEGQWRYLTAEEVKRLKYV